MGPDFLLLIGLDLVLAPLLGLWSTKQLRRLYHEDPDRSWILRLFYYSSVAINLAVLPLVALFMYAFLRRLDPSLPMFQFGLLIFAVSLFVLEIMAVYWVVELRRDHESNTYDSSRQRGETTECVSVHVDQVGVGSTVAVDDPDVDAHFLRADPNR